MSLSSAHQCISGQRAGLHVWASSLVSFASTHVVTPKTIKIMLKQNNEDKHRWTASKDCHPRTRCALKELTRRVQ